MIMAYVITLNQNKATNVLAPHVYKVIEHDIVIKLLTKANDL